MTDRSRAATAHTAGTSLPDHIRAFLDDERFATISTVDPDGLRLTIAGFESQDRISFRFRADAVHDHLDDD
jgi:hypothetical protein